MNRITFIALAMVTSLLGAACTDIVAAPIESTQQQTQTNPSDPTQVRVNPAPLPDDPSIHQDPGFALSAAHIPAAIDGKLVGGEHYNLEFNLRVWNDSDCPTCNAQVVLSMGDGGQSICVFNGVPAVHPGATSTLSATFDAPLAGGAHAIRGALIQGASCDDALTDFGALTVDEMTSLGDIVVMEPLKVLSMVPAPGATNVGIDGTVVLTFSSTLGIGASMPVLSDAAGKEVAGHWFAAGETATFTADSPLDEFRSHYTVTLGTHTLSFEGAPAAPFTATFETQMVVEEVVYSLRAGGQVLGVDFDYEFAKMDAYDRGWTFVATSTVGRYLLVNPTAKNMALEGADESSSAHLATAEPYTGRIWNLTRLDGKWMLRNVNHGEAKALEAQADGSVKMVDTDGQSAGQMWTIVRQ